MEKKNIRKILFVLGKEHCLDVMINVYKNGWQTASEVAKDLDLHIATAVKYLSELHELGLMNRRKKRGKTREAFEYQLTTSKIKIEFDVNSLMGKKTKADSKPLVLFSVLFTMLMKSRKVVGHSVDVFVNGRFEKLQNGEKDLVMDSLMFEGDLEDARNFFQKNLEFNHSQKKGVYIIPPLSYLEFLYLMDNAKLVLSDSGGIQEETTVLGIPCLTLRENTERPVTIKEGTNILVGTNKNKIIKESFNILISFNTSSSLFTTAS